MQQEFIVNQPQSIIDFLRTKNSQVVWEEKIKNGFVRVGPHYVGMKYQVNTGDRIIYDPLLEIKEPKVDSNYQIIYQDEFLVVIDKPAPLPIHPTGSYFHNTLTRLLKSQSHHWHTLHRLDSETSGVFFLAKKTENVKILSHALIEGDKTYVVMVYGKTPKHFIVSIPLGRKLKSKVNKRQGYDKEGKESLTLFKRIYYYPEDPINGSNGGRDSLSGKSLLFAHPKTGRTHQIRAHLSENGFPIVGDKIYGKNEEYFIEFLEKGWSLELEKNLELPRQFLHCYKISFFHPFLKKKIIFKSKLPTILDNHIRQAKGLLNNR